jgi:hypothetical protein
VALRETGAPFVFLGKLMKRISITGADRDPTGAHLLREDLIAEVGGVVEGERVVVVLLDELAECEAVVTRYPGWEPHLFAREAGPWRGQE